VHLHLAQYNIATLRRPLDDPASASYVALLDEVNALAEASPGFVWRHGIDSRDESTSVYENPLTLVNMSVWETLAHLKDYAYRGFHRDVFRRRQEWFDGSGAVMWWIPAGTIPTLAEGVERLEFLRRHGPTPYGFETGQKHPELVMVERTATDPDVLALVGPDAADGTDRAGATVHLALLEGRAIGAVAQVDGRVRTWTTSGAAALESGASEVIGATGEPAATDWLVAALEAHARTTSTA
jgi:hypothetical protein